MVSERKLERKKNGAFSLASPSQSSPLVLSSLRSLSIKVQALVFRALTCPHSQSIREHLADGLNLSMSQ